MEPRWLHSPPAPPRPRREPGRAGGPAQVPEPPRELDLRQVAAAVRDSPRRVALVALGVLLLGVLYLLLAPRVYRSDALVQIEDKTRPPTSLNELAFIMYAGETPEAGEVEVLRSRSLLGAVVDELGLDVVVAPRRVPLVGAALARWRADAGPAAAPPGLARFAWGGERLEVGRLTVPERLLGRALVLVSGDAGRYRLLAPGGRALLEGLVGAPAAAELPGGGGRIELLVTRLWARPRTEFRLTRRRHDAAVRDLQEALAVTPRGRERGAGVLQLSLEDASAERAARTLDSVCKHYVRQNVERQGAEAQKTLEFIDQQLPAQRAAVDAAQAALGRYRSGSKGHLDLTLEAQSTLNTVVEMEKQLSEVELQRASMRQRFTPSHPAIGALQRQAEQLRGSIAEANARLKRLPESEVDAARLERDARVANEVYVAMLNRAQELRMVRSGAVGNVRVLDAALVPFEPARPVPALVLVLSLVLGLGLGVGAAVWSHRGVRDPEALEAATGLSVYALVPHAAAGAAPRARGRRREVLAASDPGALAVESLRSLRTSLRFALSEARNNVVCVGGPGPQVGKSFVLANLAHVLAQEGQRVLLVDADLRKGRLHEYFGGGGGAGLAEVLGGACSLEDAVRRGVAPNLDVLSRGARPPNPAEMLGSARFEQLVGAMAAAWDLVLLDVPPVLAVTDAALVARHAGVNLLVLRHGRHELREVVLALKRLEQGGAHVSGLVLNDVPLVSRTGSDRSGYLYQYDYR